MTDCYKLPLSRPLAGLRVHAAPAADAPPDDKARWLLDLREAADRRKREHEALVGTLTALAAAVRPLPGIVETRLGEVAALATELGMALAREIVGAALDRGICDPTPVVEHCLRDAVRGGGKLTVRLHPADLGAVLESLEQHPELRQQAAGADFAGDPAIGRGAVQAETDTGRLVYDPAQVLERLCEELRRELRP